MSEKIMALHPAGKTGTNIDKEKYDTIKEAILSIIDEQDEVSFMGLTDAVGAHLTNFDGSVGWYVTTVKLDLEARDIIERIPNQSPQRLRRKS